MDTAECPIRAVAARLGGGLSQRHPMYDGLDAFGSEIEIFDDIYSSAGSDGISVRPARLPMGGSRRFDPRAGVSPHLIA